MKIKIAIVGTGQRAVAFAQLCSQSDKVELTALCDINKSRLESFAANDSFFVKTPKLYCEFDKLLDDNICDAVIITVPDKFHREIAEKAFAAGKHCMLEKPMAITIEDCEAIIRAQRKSNRVLQIGFVLRYTPFYKKIKSILKSGILGQIMAIDMCEFLSVSHSASYMRRWHRKKCNCGSFILTKCSHDLDILSWLAASKPANIASFGGNNFFLPRKQPASHCSKCKENLKCPYEFLKQTNNFVFIDEDAKNDLSKYDFDLCVFNNDKDIVDNQVVIIEYKNKVRACFSLQCFYPGIGERKIRINGSDAYLEGEFRQNRIEITKTSNNKKTIIDLSNDVALNDSHGGGDKPFFDEFIDCIMQCRQPVADLEAGLTSNILAQSIDQALMTKTVITV